MGLREGYEDHECLSLNAKVCLCLIFLNYVEEEREELREQVYNAMGEKDESRRTAEESTVQTEVEVQLENKDIEMEQVKEEKKERVKSVEDLTLGEKVEEAIVQEKHGGNEVSSDCPLEDGAARDENPIVAETAAGEKPVVAEEAAEDITVKKAVVGDEAAEEANPISEETKKAVGEDIVPTEKEEKLVLEKTEEEAGKLVVPAAEKEGDKIDNNLVVEKSVNMSGEEVSKTELVTAIEKIEHQVEKTEEKERSSEDNAEKIDTVEQVVNMKEKEELKEPPASGDACFSTPNETITAGTTEQSHEAQSEEKAEAAAKVEKEEEKDEEMGEGEGNRDRG